MMSKEQRADQRWTLDRVVGPAPKTIADHVREGLSRAQKTLPPLLFYDTAGSQLFEHICSLPEYYPTRTERTLIARHAAELVEHCQKRVTVVELGSGTSEKTALILRAMVAGKRDVRYVPIDVSEWSLRDGAQTLSRSLPIEIHGLIGEYEPALAELPSLICGQCLGMFLGSSLGNYEPRDAEALLRRAGAALRTGDLFLLGLDLVKDAAVLERAYDDEAGVTAAFNLNLLERLNRELGANFVLADFEHRARWNAAQKRIEMHLVSRRSREVLIGDDSYRFAEGETIHTENSYKYELSDVQRLAQAGGFEVIEAWTDARGWFSLNLFRKIS